MTTRVGAIVVGLAAALLLAGCGLLPTGRSSSGAAGPGTSASSAAVSTAPSPSATSSGTRIEGTGYDYRVPAGWETPDTKVDTGKADSFAADLKDTDGFTDNVNVVIVKGGEVTVAQAEAQGPEGLKSYGAKEVKVRPRVQVVGKETAHVTAVGTASGTDYRVDQYYLAHSGTTYVVTFSFSADVTQAERDETAAPVLASWEWT